MTIYTTDGSLLLSKKDGKEHVYEVDVHWDEKKAFTVPDEQDFEVYSSPVEPLPRRRGKGKRLALQCCLIMGMVVGLGLCVLGSFYLYIRSNQVRYSGWCQIMRAPNMTVYYENGTVAAQTHLLPEKIEIDNDIETLEIPKYDETDRALITHDFIQNVTGIRDETDSVCYILPLDRKKIPAPRTFVEFLYQLNVDDYVPDAKEIQEDYRVSSDPVTDVYDEYGEAMDNLCAGLETYWLVRVEDSEESSEAFIPRDKLFGMYAGGDWFIKYHIM